MDKIKIEIDVAALERYHRYLNSTNLQDTLDRVLEQAGQDIIDGTIGYPEPDGNVVMSGYGRVATWEVT